MSYRTMNIGIDVLDRFLAKRKTGPGCWGWTGCVAGNGYGKLKVCRRYVSAHRLAWFFRHDEWPAEGLVVRHKCDNPGCVRPDHLEIGTHADNVADKVAKGRQARGTRTNNAKLTEAQVLAIRGDPRPQRAIAAEYGVGQSLVSRIRASKRWQHAG